MKKLFYDSGVPNGLLVISFSILPADFAMKKHFPVLVTLSWVLFVHASQGQHAFVGAAIGGHYSTVSNQEYNQVATNFETHSSGYWL